MSPAQGRLNAKERDGGLTVRISKATGHCFGDGASDHKIDGLVLGALNAGVLRIGGVEPILAQPPQVRFEELVQYKVDDRLRNTEVGGTDAFVEAEHALQWTTNRNALD